MTAAQRSSGSRRSKRATRKNVKDPSVLELVREGVRRFILDEASMSEFHRAMRAADKKGEMSPNPLNGATLRRIVKSAVRERKRSTKNRTERS